MQNYAFFCIINKNIGIFFQKDINNGELLPTTHDLPHPSTLPERGSKNLALPPLHLHRNSDATPSHSNINSGLKAKVDWRFVD